MQALKYSRQREAILQSLKARFDHPTAEMLYEEVRQVYPNISLGTVYRNLSLLCDCGIIKKLNCGDNAEHFDGKISPHYHFICNCCHCVSDLEMDNIDFINTLAANSFQGKIAGNCTYFYGICKECLDKGLETC